MDAAGQGGAEEEKGLRWIWAESTHPSTSSHGTASAVQVLGELEGSADTGI